MGQNKNLDAKVWECRDYIFALRRIFEAVGDMAKAARSRTYHIFSQVRVTNKRIIPDKLGTVRMVVNAFFRHIRNR